MRANIANLLTAAEQPLFPNASHHVIGATSAAPRSARLAVDGRGLDVRQVRSVAENHGHYAELYARRVS